MEIRVTLQNESKTMEEALEDFMFHCKYEKGLSGKTLKAYQIDLSQLKEYLRIEFSTEKIEMVTKEMIKSYLQTISDYKYKTIKRKIASMKTFFAFYEFENETFINPFRKLKIRLKEPQVLPTVMCCNEVKRILNFLYQERMKNKKNDGYAYKSQTRNIAIVELLFATGIRVSELCQLQYKDIDLINGIIKVYGKGNKERIIQICSKEVISILKDYYAFFKPDSYFFINRLGHEISPQSVRLLVRRCTNTLNLSKHITPHTFRHTFATLLLEEDVDIKYIQNLLGHSSIVTTQIYTHVNLSKQKKILSNKHPRNKFDFNQ